MKRRFGKARISVRTLPPEKKINGRGGEAPLAEELRGAVSP